MSVTIKVLNAKQTVSTHKVTQGRPVVLQAKNNVNYQLTDDQTGFGPQNILTKRDGDNLVVMLENGDMQPDIIIENYYSEKGTSNLITGLHENGKIYAYVPESGKVGESISLLAEEVIAPQALGGTELVVPFWAFNPWWLGGIAGVAGVAALLAGGSGGKGGAAQAVEPAPVNKPTGENESIPTGQPETPITNTPTPTLTPTPAPTGGIPLPPPNPDIDADGRTDVQEIRDAGKEIDALADLVKQYNDLVETFKNNGGNAAQGLISPSEAQILSGLRGLIEQTQKELKDKFGEFLPNISGKSGVLADLAKIQVELVESNDKDGDGRIDQGTPDSELSQTQNALTSLSGFYRAVGGPRARIPNLKGKKAITPEDRAEVVAVNAEIEKLKAEVQKMINGLPDGVGDKQALQAQLNAIQAFAVPAVTDVNRDGNVDSAADLVNYAQQLDRAVRDEEAKLKLKTDLITPQDRAKLDALNRDLAAAKEAALAKIEEELKDNPNDQALKRLKSEDIEGLEQTDEQLFPITDRNSDGINDLNDAGEKVEAAVEASRKAKEKYDELVAKGVVNPEDNAELKQLNQAVEKAKKAAEEAIALLPEDQSGRTGLLEQMEEVVTQPELAINDSNADGTPDSAAELVAYAQQLAEKAKTALQEAGEAPTAAQQAAIQSLNDQILAAKAAAKAALDQLPKSNDKQKLADDLAKVQGVIVPDVANNGDATAETADDAERKVKAAEALEAKAQTLKANIEADGAISAEEAAQLEALNEQIETAKAAAKQAVDALPDDNEAKKGLTERTNEVETVTVREVNDRDNDGKPDNEEYSRALALGEAVKAAKAEAEAALKAVTKDGIVNPQEQQAVIEANKKLQAALDKFNEAAKAIPDAYLDSLPQGKEAVKAAFAELANSDGKPVDVPAVNDSNSDGKIDTPAELVAYAEQLAQQAKTEKEKLVGTTDEPKENPAITPAQKAALDNLNKQVEAAKQAALDAIEKAKTAAENNRALSAEQKEETQRALDALKADANAVEPQSAVAVTDADADGTLDSAEIANVTEKADELAEKVTAAQQKLDQINAKAAITPEDQQAIATLNEEIQAAKAELAKLADELPNTEEGKAKQEALAQQLAAIDPLPLPVVNDLNADGTPDSPSDLVAKAEALEKAAEELLKTLNENDAISPQDVAALEKANAKVAAAKQAAKQAITAAKEAGTLSEEDAKAFTTRLDNVDEVQIPAVNDRNNDGTIDSEEPEADNVEALIAAAEKARDEAQAKLDQLRNDDGLYSADEAAQVAELNKVVDEAKQAAQAALDKLPEGDEKAKLAERLDDVQPAEAPITDKDNDGKADSTELDRAIDLVNKAAALAEAAKKAEADAKKDGAVNPEEAKKVEELNEQLAAAKKAAEAAIQDLPKEDAAEAAKLTQRLEEQQPTTKPSVNDQDSDGTPDNKELERAQALLEEAKAAKQAADNALENAKKNGLITPTEKAAVDEANQKLADAKAKLEEAVKGLPTEGESLNDVQKAAVQQLKDALKTPTTLAEVESPVVTDNNSDGKADSPAELVEAAIKAAAKAKEKLAEIKQADTANTPNQAENNITAEERAELDKLVKDAEAAKAAAEKAVNDAFNAPNNTAEERVALRAEKAKLDDPQNQPPAAADLPAVNDRNNNGKDDETERTEALEAARQALDVKKAALDEAVRAATGVTEAQQQAVAEANKALEAAKAAAEKALSELPTFDDEAKDNEIAEKLDAVQALKPAELPAVTAKDDDTKLNAEELVKAAQAAEKAAQQTLEDALNDDGVIDAEEQAEIIAANEKVAAAKKAADAAVKVLDDDAEKAELGEQLKDVAEVPVPDVTANDAARKAADEAVKEAERKEAEIEAKRDELLKDGILSPDDKAVLDSLNEELKGLKEAAADKVAELPADEQTPFSQRLDDVQPVDSSANDANDDKAKDATQLANATELLNRAEALQQEAKKLAEQAAKNGTISADEKAKVDEAIAAYNDAKEAAEEAINDLSTPSQDTDKQGLTDRLAKIEQGEQQALTADDLDNDGEKDTAEVDRAKALLDEAKKAKAAYDEAMKATTDGTTPAEQAKVAEAVKAFEDAKRKALEAVNGAPENTAGKADTKTAIEALKLVEPTTENPNPNPIPAVTQNEQGDPLSVSELADKAAEAAQAAKQALEEAKKPENGESLTPEEVANINALVDAAEAAKKAAEKAVTEALANNPNDPDATAAQTKLGNQDEVPTTEKQEANDVDGDGKLDSAEAQTAQDKLTAAQAAKLAVEAAKQAVDDANGNVTPELQQALINANEALRKAVEAAEKAIDELPNGVGDKTAKEAALESLTPAEVPAVTAKDDGTKLTAEELVKEAQKLEKEAETLRDELTKNPPVTEDKRAALAAKNAQVEAAKEAAQAAIREAQNATPEPTDEEKAKLLELSEQAAAVQPALPVPQADSAATKLDEAQKAVEAAEAAEKAAEKALTDAEEDGVITAEEKDAIAAANDKVDAAKQAAKQALDNYKADADSEPAAAQNLQERLNNVDAVAVPQESDKDKDGKDDAEELARKDRLVEEAAQAKRDFDKALAKAQENGLITPAEQKDLLAKQAEYEAKKAKALEAIEDTKNLEGAKPTEDTDKLPKLAPYAEGKTSAVPPVNDSDNNGQADNFTQLADEASRLAKEAEKAATEAKGTDGIISAEEQAKVNALIDAANAAKEAAQEAINTAKAQDPQAAGIAAAEAKLNSATETPSTEKLKANDFDGDGKNDSDELAAAKAKVAAAQAKKDEVDAKARALAEAEQNGNGITEAQRKELQAANDQLAKAKFDAEQAIKGLPTQPNATATEDGAEVNIPTKAAELSGALNAMPLAEEKPATKVEENGQVRDMTPQELINQAKALEQAAQTDAEIAKADGNSPVDDDLIDRRNKALEAAKAKAQEAINEVKDEEATQTPNPRNGDDLQEQLDGVGNGADKADSVNDQDDNKNVDDSSTAKQKLEEAKQALKAAQDKLDEIKQNTEGKPGVKDDIITTADQNALKQANAALEEAKKAALVEINKLPEGNEKAKLLQELNDLTPPTVPEVNTLPVVTLTAKEGGNVEVSLPAAAEVGDTVVMKVTKPGETEETTVNLTKGANGWTSDNTAIVPSTTGNTTTIPANRVKDSSQVKAQTQRPGYTSEDATPATALVGQDSLTKPTLTAENGGSVTIALPTSNVENGDTVEVTYKKPDGTDAKVTLTKGASGWTSNDTAISVNGNSATLAAASVKDGTEVNATTKRTETANGTFADAAADPVTTQEGGEKLITAVKKGSSVDFVLDDTGATMLEIKRIPDGGTDVAKITLEKVGDTWKVKLPKQASDYVQPYQELASLGMAQPTEQNGKLVFNLPAEHVAGTGEKADGTDGVVSAVVTNADGVKVSSNEVTPDATPRTTVQDQARMDKDPTGIRENKPGTKGGMIVTVAGDKISEVDVKFIADYDSPFVTDDKKGQSVTWTLRKRIPTEDNPNLWEVVDNGVAYRPLDKGVILTKKGENLDFTFTPNVLAGPIEGNFWQKTNQTNAQQPQASDYTVQVKQHSMENPPADLTAVKPIVRAPEYDGLFVSVPNYSRSAATALVGGDTTRDIRPIDFSKATEPTAISVFYRTLNTPLMANGALKPYNPNESKENVSINEQTDWVMKYYFDGTEVRLLSVESKAANAPSSAFQTVAQGPRNVVISDNKKEIHFQNYTAHTGNSKNASDVIDNKIPVLEVIYYDGFGGFPTLATWGTTNPAAGNVDAGNYDFDKLHFRGPEAFTKETHVGVREILNMDENKFSEGSYYLNEIRKAKAQAAQGSSGSEIEAPDLDVLLGDTVDFGIDTENLAVLSQPNREAPQAEETAATDEAAAVETVSVESETAADEAAVDEAAATEEAAATTEAEAADDAPRYADAVMPTSLGLVEQPSTALI